MLRILFSFVCLFGVFSLQASGVRGTVRDQAGKPLEFTSVYVNETATGAVTNAEGYYELRLAPGSYTLVFQYLGYETAVRNVTVRGQFEELDVTLATQSFQLEAINVVAGDEDPAYTIMRKAIAKADYHRNQLDYYQAEVYVKGSGRLLQSPFLLRRLIEREGVDSTVAFATESVSVIEYERPNTFRERVISVYTTGEDNSSSPMPFINGSFYEAEIAGAVSPLSPRAFGYYRFKWEGHFSDRGYVVNKIRVQPRSRGDNVFDGYLYIIEDQWSIHSLELTTYTYGIRFDMSQLYAPVQEQVWLPVNARFVVTGKIFGFGFEYNYLTTIDDYDVRLNPDLPVDLQVIDEKVNRELAAQLEAQRKEDPSLAETNEKLLSGEELTRKELRKLMREYEQEEASAQEAPEVVSNYSFEVDSTAYERDSAFWAEVRPLPLTEYELRGYERIDSISREERAQAEQDADGVANQRNNGQFELEDLFFGESYRLGKDRFLVYESPLFSGGFNPVEGGHYSTSLIYRRRGDNRWNVGGSARYGFSWKRLNFKTFADHTFGKKDRRHTIAIEGGRFISQYNPENPIAEFFNTYYALFREQNFLRIYEKEYGAITWRQNWASNANLSLGAEWANRRFLQNTTTQTWFPKDDRAYASNIPEVLETFPQPAREKALVLQAALSVKPWQKYRIANGNKQAIEHSSPVFTLGYRKGLGGVAESVTDFDLLELTYQHKIRIPARGILDLRVNAGAFLNNNYVGLPDFKHFPGNQILFTTADPVASFRFLPYYLYSTREEFLAAHLHYQFRKLLLTQIWEVQLLGLRENVFFNYLATPESQNYFEVGYSLDNILRFLRVEVGAHFINGTYQNIGVRIGVASNIGIGGFNLSVN